MEPRWRPLTSTWSEPTENLERRQAMHADLLALEDAIGVFVGGEISRGLITDYKLTILVAVRTARAVANSARQDLLENKVSLG